ncbi:hypothetical protein [Bosea sp. MMO-172]|uniref:hypothetical protein n=1 Tax=Bosea sp. MMO-172 TaxID=3127885 RepID=UPI00301A5E94
MSHVALARHFWGVRAGRPGLSRRELLEDLQPLGLASRNTAAAFFSEVLHYGIIQPAPAAGRATDLFVPAPATLSALTEWFALHLGALDRLDDGDRVAHLRQREEALLIEMQPRVAAALLGNRTIRTPPPTYAIFASIDDGGSLMDRLICGLDAEAAPHQEQALTNVTSVSALARKLNLSRTHAGRTLAAAVAVGALGWSGAPGHSRLWLSRAFRAEYAQMQAMKLAILDDAFEATVSRSASALAAEMLGPKAEETRANPPH